MDKEAQQPISEKDFDTPSNITPADRQGCYKEAIGCGVFAFGIILPLCGLSWLYTHYSYLHYFKPGVALFNQHQYPAAERDFQSYVHLENDPDGHYYLGRTFLIEGKTTEARAEFLQDGNRISGSTNGWRPNPRSAPYLRQLKK